MKRELWMQALEELPDEWLEEAGAALEVSGGVRRRGRHRWLRIIAAACLILSLCGNVFAVAWVRSRGEQLAQQEDFYLRYLTEAAQDLRSDTFDAERFFAALDSTDDETVYIAVNRLVECYNDPALRARAIEAVEPFRNSPSQMIADSAERVSAVLRETFDAEGIVRLPDGGALFTLFPGMAGGDAPVLWRIENGVLSAWWTFGEPYQYITGLLASPDGGKLAVCLASGKSGFLVVFDFETGKVSGELMHTVLAAVRAQDGLPAHIRADFETYSFAERVHWTAQGSLAFDAALYFAPEGTDGQRTVIYHPDSGSLEIG